jgi:hypothetical protein
MRSLVIGCLAILMLIGAVPAPAPIGIEIAKADIRAGKI